MNAKTSRRFLLVAAPFVYAAPLVGGCIVGLQYKGKAKILYKQTSKHYANMNTGNERLKQAFEWLKKEGAVRNQAHFGQLIGESSSGNLSNYLTGKKAIGEDVIQRFAVNIEQKLPMLSVTWLRTGEGEMLRGEPNPGAGLPDVGRRTDVWVGTDNRVYWTEAVQVGHEEDLQRAQSEGVRLIPEYTEAFRGGNRGEADELQTIDTYWGIPNLEGEMIVPIHGNSMSPKFPAGCRVALKRYPFSPANPLGIQFGEVYAVAVRQGDGYPPLHFIKRLHRHTDKAKERTTYIARSINPDYDDFEVSVSDICHLSAVVARIEVEPLFSF